MDVTCMLFTDLLLVTKSATKRGGGDKLKIIKPPMRLDKIIVYGLRDAGTSAAVVYCQLAVSLQRLATSFCNLLCILNSVLLFVVFIAYKIRFFCAAPDFYETYTHILQQHITSFLSVFW